VDAHRIAVDPNADPNDPASPNRTLTVLEILRGSLGDSGLRDSLIDRGMKRESADRLVDVLRRRRRAMGG
jgi:hypothetical protein